MVEEHAAPSETVVVEKAVEAEAIAEKAVEAEVVAEKPVQLRSIEVTPEIESPPPGMGGGGPPDPELMELARSAEPSIDSAEKVIAGTEQPEMLAASKEQATAQPLPAAVTPLAATVVEAEPEVHASPTAEVALPTPTQPPTATRTPSPSPVVEPTRTVAPEVVAIELRPTRIPLHSPTPPPSERPGPALGWWTPLRTLEVALGGLFAVLLFLSFWFRRR
jgi:hypothetical protein